MNPGVIEIGNHSHQGSTLRRAALRVLFIAVAVSVLAAPVAAQDSRDESAKLLQRMYTPGEFSVKSFGPARWIENGGAYTTVEAARGQSEVLEIVRYGTSSSERRVLISAAQLTPAGAKQALIIDDYQWSADANRLLIFTNTKPVWRDNTRGDYWVLDRKAESLKKLGANAKESTLLFAKFSPDGARVAYVRENNIYVEEVAGGKITQLTRDGSDAIINGTTDWVYEEELSIRDGFRWSPDGTKIAFWNFDTKGAGVFPLIYYTGKPREIQTGMPYPGTGAYPVVQNFPYPLAGSMNSAARIGVISSTGGAITWMKVPGDPRQNYIPRMEWAQNSTEVIIEQTNRLQNEANVWIAA